MDSWSVPGARVWDLCSREAGRAPGPGRSWATSLDSPSSSLDCLLWASSPTPNAPRVCSKLGKGAGTLAG